MTAPTNVNGSIHIFTVPLESPCSGTVVDMQYCYQRNGSGSLVFTFLHLTRDNLTFTFQGSFRVLPHSEMCTSVSGTMQICCATTMLERFGLNGTNFTFGIDIGRNGVTPLFFVSSVAEYQLEQFQLSLSKRVLFPGRKIILNESSPGSTSFPLLRFLIGINHQLCYVCLSELFGIL